ncbi:MAG: hypothetical protein K2J79_11190 [Ruminiclostridium sp.]|nr:hypothetical protein [Ruminiclostridium sp.]
MENYFDMEISPIELLGYAKNYIVDVEEQRIDLPDEVQNKLLFSFIIIQQENQL